MKNITKKLNEVEKLINDSIPKEECSNNTEMAMIPLAMYELGENRRERRENKLLKIISTLCISFGAVVILIVGGFLWFLNQYEFSYSFYQKQTDTMGDATIEDGIHYNDKDLNDIT